MNFKIILLAAGLVILSCKQPTSLSPDPDKPMNCPPKKIAEFPAVKLPSGQIVSQSRFIVYFFIGHSNMALGGSFPESTLAIDNGWYFAVPGYETVKPIDPEQTDALWFNKFFKQGPGPNFINEMAKRHPDYYFGAVQNARTAGSIYRDYSPGQDLYEEIIRIGKELKGTVTFGGIIAMIGIYESIMGKVTDGMDSGAFLQRLESMVNGIRCELSEPELPFFIGELEKYGAAFENWTDGNFIDRMIWEVPNRITNSYVIPCNGIDYADGHHFSLAGQNIWARRVIDTIETNKLFITHQCEPESLPGPQNISIYSLSDSSAFITWDHQFVKSSFVQSYQIITQDSTKYSMPGHKNSIEVPFTGNTTTISVSSVDVCGNVSSTSKITINRDSISQPLPAIIDSVTNITDTSVTVYWHPQENTQNVVYHIKDNDGKLYASAISTGPIKISNLASGTTYIFGIESYHVLSGISQYSERCTVRTMEAKYIETYPFSINCGGFADAQYNADMEYLPGASYGYNEVDDLTECKYDTISFGKINGSARIGKNIRYLLRVPEPRVYRISLNLFDGWGKNMHEYNQVLIINNRYFDEIYFFNGSDRLPPHQKEYLVGTNSGLINLDLRTIYGRALVNGITLDTIPVYKIISPTKSNTVYIGDTLNIEFECDYLRATSAVIEISKDDGISWDNITRGVSMLLQSTPLQSYKWRCSLPGETEAVAVIIRIKDYTRNQIYDISEKFNIVPR